MQAFTPTHYTLRLTPDLDTFHFSGEVRIDGRMDPPGDQVRLNLLELAVFSCHAEHEGTRSRCAYSVDPAAEELCIHLPASISGALSITVAFEGVITDRMAGFYRSGYRIDNETRYVAVTQFEESDARRAFPCQDHPRRKATFDVTLVVAPHLKAISNEKVQKITPLPDGRQEVRFERTPRMSTYLLFFGVGDFDSVGDDEDDRVRIITVPGRRAYTGYGLRFGRQALQYSEAYYGIDYPLAKMDLIAIPDFAFGAMENWGAITFRENLLLHYPAFTSRAGEVRICEVVAHEIAHQWFGNLVTPSEWKYLWLNESFATFFGYGVVNHYHPRWDVWEQFIAGQTETALARDGLQANFAIEIPGGEHVVINTSTAPIIYSKGASILRHLRGYIGGERFQEGLRYYLGTHAYGNAASRHLWESFDAVSDRPVTRMMQGWITRAGHPLVRVRREGENLVLKQRRFTYLPNDDDGCWEIPVSVLLITAAGETARLETLMRGPRCELHLEGEAAAYKVNCGQTGFYRVQYLERGDLEALGPCVRDQILGPEDRWGLQNDLFALVQSEAAAFDNYLDFLAHYRQETAYLPLVSITGHLLQAYIVAGTRRRQQIAQCGRQLMETLLETIGWEPSEREGFTTSLLRDAVWLPMVWFGSQTAATLADASFDGLRGGVGLNPDLLDSVLQVAACLGDTDRFEWMRRRFESSPSEHERLLVLKAFGAFADWQLLERALDYTLEAVPERNRFVPVMAAARNPAAVEHLWPWFLERRGDLETWHPLLYERVIAAVVPVGGLDRGEAVRRFFDDYCRQRSALGDVVALCLEKLAINERLRQQLADGGPTAGDAANQG
jgi:tricorn protease interacting factor F2/3